MSDEHIESLPDTPEEELQHYGIIRKSGRYPWGSGKDPYQRSLNFYALRDELKKKGLTERQIAEGLGLIETEGIHKGKPSTSMLRATISAAKDEKIKAERAMVRKLKEKNWSNTAIGNRLNMPESTVRALLAEQQSMKRDRIQKTVASLKEDLKEYGGYLDVGLGTEQEFGVPRDTLKVALRLLKEEGYQVHYLKVPQMGHPGQFTSTQVLAPPGIDYSEFRKNQDQVRTARMRLNSDSGEFEKPHTPKSVSSKRLEVVFAEDGGTDRDGLIELRPGAKDLSLGNKHYAQVRIAVDDSHYIKGMAIYNDELPDGVDIRFHTNKPKGTPVLGSKDDTVLKNMKDDPTDRFGSQIKAGGQRGALNIVNEEGDWSDWSSKLSSQMLSKQKPELAKQQLGLTYDIKKAELDEIRSLTNPTVKQALLRSYADDVDAQAVRLKAQGLPGTKNHVILPIPEMKDTEIYAPGYQNGDRVALIRHPHGGIFEIPELVVNNKNAKAKKLLGQAQDAVGIAPSVAEKLSGADFDGDTVLVIPQRPKTYIQNKDTLKELKNFDPKIDYKIPKDDTTTSRMRNTQLEMGLISNLITDMTVQGADDREIARAVRHSMVVIDAEKHGLDYKQSYVDNGIAELKKTYQGSTQGGASTIISKAKSEANVPRRKPRPAALGGPIDPETGKRVFVETGESYLQRRAPAAVERELAEKHSKSVGEIRKMIQAGKLTDPRVKEKVIYNTTKSTKMAEAEDARTLMSNGGLGTPIERVYADHANKLKALGNEARKELLATPNLKYNDTANKVYRPEVETLVAKLAEAERNKPLERNAQLIAGLEVSLKKQENPQMDKDTLKKVEAKALSKARIRTGASKKDIEITPREWEAIQAGAISHNRLSRILANTDADKLKELATPRTKTGIPPAKEARIKAFAARGYGPAEIAAALGLSVSAVSNVMYE